jgi:hypothetical protein
MQIAICGCDGAVTYELGLWVVVTAALGFVVVVALGAAELPQSQVQEQDAESFWPELSVIVALTV